MLGYATVAFAGYPLFISGFRYTINEIGYSRHETQATLLVYLSASNALLSYVYCAGGNLISLLVAFVLAAVAYRLQVIGPAPVDVDMSGKVCIITGSSSGIGLSTAAALVRMGAHVILGARAPLPSIPAPRTSPAARTQPSCRSRVRASRARLARLARTACRSEKKALEARDEIARLCPRSKGKAEFMQIDLSSFKSVHAFAASFKAKGLPLHVLVNNAGVMQHERLLTEDGNEMTLQANYLGHFLLTNLLLAELKATAKKGGGARIVNISSSMHWVRARAATSRSADRANSRAPPAARARPRDRAIAAQGEKEFDFEDIQGEKRYAIFRAYEQSKLAQLLSTMELDRRLRGSGVTVNAVHPGSVITDVTRGFHPLIRIGERLTTPLQYAMRKPRDAGAYTATYCAVSPEVQATSGKYFWNCREELRSPLVDCKETQTRLWALTEKLVA
jgi:NAD(P)-dependent dehydrogenase (short-subunit alcohol dehydrogenase family)